MTSCLQVSRWEGVRHGSVQLTHEGGKVVIRLGLLHRLDPRCDVAHQDHPSVNVCLHVHLFPLGSHTCVGRKKD